MKAVVIREFGGPEVLRIEELPVPVPGPGQLLIRVHAVSVNQALDVQLRAGTSGLPVKLPITPGIDPSGVVEAVGTDATRFKPGDRVAAILPPTVSGGYAEYVLVDEASANWVPDELGFPTATVVRRHFPAAFNQMRLAQVETGETVLVIGAAGALASCLVQLCKEAGATVIAGAGSDERVKAALGLGADHGINYRRCDLTREVMALTESRGVDVVLENVGEPRTWQAAVASLARGGRLITVGTHGGDGILPLDVRLLYRNRLKIMSGLGPQEQRDEVDQVMTRVAKGQYRVLIDRVLPLSRAEEAHRIVEDNAVVGKVIIDPTQG